jgi:hypothetical protein
MPDESSRRKPGFIAGCPVTLADGQEWTFPLPKLRLSPRRAEDRYVITAGRVGFPRYREWVEAITAAPGQIGGIAYWNARMDAAATLLRANYDLSDDEVDELLAWEDDGPDGLSTQRWSTIDRAILGLLPKASSDTSS